MEPAGKIDIKSELYRAVVPQVVRLTRAALTRYRELPKLDVLRNFILLYLAVGFIVEGIAGVIPAFALSFIGISPDAVGMAFFLFWPAITWGFVSEEHAILSIAILFIGAVYISHHKQRRHGGDGRAGSCPVAVGTVGQPQHRAAVASCHGARHGRRNRPAGAG